MAVTITIAASSIIYVHSDITGATDLTSDMVDAAILVDLDASPADADWQVASWDPDEPATARVLVGPGTPFVLTPGQRYQVWFRVHDAPEVPVLAAGLIAVI